MKPNLYDNVCLEIKTIHNQLDNNIIKNIYKLRKGNPLFTGALYKWGIWERLVESGFFREWFSDFKNYWIDCLHCRPIYFHDFFYLYSNYRSKFSDVAVFEGADSKQFFDSWQSYANIYLIFHSVYKYALNPLSYYSYKKYLKPNMNVLEYGCGIAPITFSALKYGHLEKSHFTIADIQGYTFSYAKWRLSHVKNVKIVNIEPDKLPIFPYKYDVVFMMAVFEHLPNPLDVVKYIYENLEENGILIFDYIKAEGQGLDTLESVRERKFVLEFIETNFEVLFGKINYENSCSTTIVEKKQMILK
jgi:2-polyprenyl-3-methyl-5-hydroxy-6-metoxy-1,4-benzoquinol methylase